MLYQFHNIKSLCFVPVVALAVLCSFYHQELLSEHNIPKMVISASRKLQLIQHHLLQNIQPLLTNRESLFQTCQPISYSLAQKLLFSTYKLHSAFGCWDPIQVGII